MTEEKKEPIIIRVGDKILAPIMQNNGKPKDHRKYRQWAEEKLFTVVEIKGDLWLRWFGLIGGKPVEAKIWLGVDDKTLD